MKDPLEALLALSPTFREDFLMALRYHYYVKGRNLIPDPMYDLAERTFMEMAEFDAFSSPLNLPGSDQPDSYHDRIKTLALYLAFCSHASLKAIAAKAKP